jgi:hypothetical protein
MIVCDSFDHWKRSRASKIMNLFSKECTLDRRLDDLIRILQADVYWGYIKREGLEEYYFHLEKIESENNTYIETVMKKFEKLILQYPQEYYAWSEIDGLYS